MKLQSWFALSCVLAAVACGKDIGDSCKSVNECITTDTDRLCLTQDGEGFPGGYCSKFNCGGSNACPEEAVCVAYRYTLGGGACNSDSSLSRLQRNYCMLRCDDDSDCRDGYKCLTADGDNPLGATIIDGNAGVKICGLEYYQPAKAPKRDSEVCEPEGLLDVADAAALGETSTVDPTGGDAAVSSVSSTVSAGDAAATVEATTGADAGGASGSSQR